MIPLEMFGSGLQIGMIRTITRSAHPEIQKAPSMENIGCYEVDHLWINRADFALLDATGTYPVPSLKTLDFVAQKI